MSINTTEFCHLSTAPLFQKWLYAVDYKLYLELLEHLRLGLGCKRNKQKMVEILDNITKDAIKNQNLMAFLRSNYPSIIIEDKVNHDHSKDNKHRVFSHYDPNLSTWPRRIIFTNIDSTSSKRSLSKLVDDFCSENDYCESIIIENHAYVEYLPIGYKHIKDKIPTKNWQIRSFNKNN